MRTFNGPGPSEFARWTTQEIRRDFLIDGLFEPGRIHLAATGLDRLIAGGIVPARELVLEATPELRAAHFNERRETGVINIGAPGRVVVDGAEYVVGTRECLYIGMETRDICFQSCTGAPAVYYLLSCPAHSRFPTRLVTHDDAAIVEIGDARSASRRRIVRYIHEHGVQSCQLVMGYTELEEGSVWNTWPAHTHTRRSEVYLYFDCNGGLVTHLLGVPTETRHVIVRDRQAVLSPSWSIHAGVGTRSYRFVWGMAGENRTFDDMDPIDEEVFA
jgi:4-deoxy-L-threo-5-hexosulose-uronate ketol-isomerase